MRVEVGWQAALPMKLELAIFCTPVLLHNLRCQVILFPALVPVKRITPTELGTENVTCDIRDSPLSCPVP